MYDAGSKMSPFCHETFSAQSGGEGDEETEDQWGVPERDIEVTVQPLWAAALHIRLPRNPLPPHTTSFLFAAAAEAIGAIVLDGELRGLRSYIQLVVGEE